MLKLINFFIFNYNSIKFKFKLINIGSDHQKKIILPPFYFNFQLYVKEIKFYFVFSLTLALLFFLIIVSLESMIFTHNLDSKFSGSFADFLLTYSSFTFLLDSNCNSAHILN